MSKISIDGLADEVNRLLTEYQSGVEKGVIRAAKKAANDCRKTLLDVSPVSGADHTHYADGWAVKVVNQTDHSIDIAVHNKTKPGVAHLVEHGHGGPYAAPAHPHIKPVEEMTILEFEELTRKYIKEVD